MFVLLQQSKRLMAKTGFYLDMRGKAADGMGSLQISVYYNNQTIFIPTGIRLSPSQWKNNTVVGRADSSELNAAISKKKADIDMRLALLSTSALYDGGIVYTARELKALLAGENKIKKETDRQTIDEVFSEFLRQDKANGSKEIYKSTWKKVQLFSKGKSPYMDTIDYRWLVDFNNHLVKTNSVNGRALYMRHLRAVCNFALRMGYMHQYPFEHFTIKTEPTQKRNISVELLREFYHYPTDPVKAKYRDYFFLMFFLIGINAVDLLHATHDMVHEGRLEYRRQKTHSDLLSVKIEPEAQVLLEKYKGNNYLLAAMDTCKHYKSFLHAMNDALGQIGPVIYSYEVGEDLFSEPTRVAKVEPIVPDITSYYARHTWATFAHKLGVSTDVIGLALGHSTRQRVTWVYIEPDRSKVDDANRRVIDYFLGVSDD